MVNVSWFSYRCKQKEEKRRQEEEKEKKRENLRKVLHGEEVV